MVKFRMFFDSDKETKWLNQMAEQGWAMTGFFFGGYRFTKCEPGEYIYQLDMVDKIFSLPESYRQFMCEMGVEIVCFWGFWVVLRKKAEDGPFELYTDAGSSFEHYVKIRNMFQAVSMIIAASLLNTVIYGEIFKGAAGLVTILVMAVILTVFLRESMHLSGILKDLKSRLEPGQGEASSASVLRKHGGCIAVFLCCVPFLCSFLHELGHCIAVWICGGTVTGFHPFGSDAHMTYAMGLGNISRGFVDVAGTLLPLMIAAAVLLFYRSSKKRSLLNMLLLIMSAYFISPVIVWIIEPLLCLLNYFNPREDVVHFIDDTGFHPAAVALCATLVFVSMVFLFARRMLVMFDDFSKSSVRKYIILITSIVAVMDMFFLFFAFGKVPAKGDFQYTVEGRQDSILWQELDIDISQAGDYSLYLEWEIDREGVLAAVILKDEDGIYNGASASYLTLESGPFYLDSGSYTLSFYFMSCEEDWLEYCRITGRDASGLEDYSWQPDGAATVTGNYSLAPVYGRN